MEAHRKPHVVLIPGAWHSPEAFAPFTSKLAEHGYSVHSKKLPAVGNSSPPKDLGEDIAAVRSLLDEAIGEGNDVIVIPHSWGGIIAGSALDGYGIDQRKTQGRKGGVVRTAYIAAFIVNEGVSLLDAIGGNPPPWSNVKDDQIHSIGSPFYEDLPEDQQKELRATLEPHAYGTFRAKTTAASWLQIPTSYLLCEADQAIPSFAQEAMTNNVAAKGGVIEVTRIDASHSPFLSKVDETVAWFRKTAGEVV